MYSSTVVRNMSVYVYVYVYVSIFISISTSILTFKNFYKTYKPNIKPIRNYSFAMFCYVLLCFAMFCYVLLSACLSVCQPVYQPGRPRPPSTDTPRPQIPPAPDTYGEIPKQPKPRERLSKTKDTEAKTTSISRFFIFYSFRFSNIFDAGAQK